MSEEFGKFSTESRMDSEKYKQQQEELKYYLNESETGKNRFIILNNETGFGKSRSTDKYIAKNKSRKYILVKKYNDEKTQSLESMRTELKESIWGDYSKYDKYLAINADNSYEYETELRNKLAEASVVIISHEKYRLLSNSPRLELYTFNRHTLIIDETIDVPVFSISASYFEKHRVLFGFNLGTQQFSELQICFNKWLESLNETKAHMLAVELSSYAERDKAKEIFKQLKELFHNKYYDIKKIAEEHTIKGYPVTDMDYYRFFSEMQSVLDNQCIYSSYRKELCANRKFDFWTLDNNIILDASGDILTQYKLNPELFKLKKQDKIFDYRDTTIHIKKSKSTKTEIDKGFQADEEGQKQNFNSAESYINAVVRYVVANHDDNLDRTLVISHKKHSTIFDKQIHDLKPLENVFSAWHGNILGKNNWRDCNKIFINSIFNLPEPAYVLIYAFYKGKDIEASDLEVVVPDNARVFKNKDIESLKQNLILHNLYQEIKRINREVNRVSDAYVITDNECFLKRIKKLMQNVNLIEDYDIQLPEKINVFETRLEYINIKAELERMTTADVKNRKEFSKQLFCSKTGIKSQRLKEKIEVEYIKKLCDEYGVDYKKTFTQGSKQFHFKKRKK